MICLFKKELLDNLQPIGVSRYTCLGKLADPRDQNTLGEGMPDRAFILPKVVESVLGSVLRSRDDAALGACELVRVWNETHLGSTSSSVGVGTVIRAQVGRKKCLSEGVHHNIESWAAMICSRKLRMHLTMALQSCVREGRRTCSVDTGKFVT